MKNYRIAAVICLLLIIAITVLMILALAAGNIQRFFIFGGVLIAVVIFSRVVVKTFKNRYMKEESNDGTSEN